MKKREEGRVVKDRETPIKINDFLRKTKISGMGGVQRRVGQYQDIINKDNGTSSKGDKK